MQSTNPWALWRAKQICKQFGVWTASKKCSLTLLKKCSLTLWKKCSLTDFQLWMCWFPFISSKWWMAGNFVGDNKNKSARCITHSDFKSKRTSLDISISNKCAQNSKRRTAINFTSKTLSVQKKVFAQKTKANANDAFYCLWLLNGKCKSICTSPWLPLVEKICGPFYVTDRTNR